MSTASNPSRRAALGALVAFTAAPAIALPPAGDQANAIWKDRQASVERLTELVARYSAADEMLPSWARSGLDRIDHEGNPCGENSGWPLDASVTPPQSGERITRPTIEGCRETFAFKVRILGLQGKARERARAYMRQSIAHIIARRREQDRLYAELGLLEMDRKISNVCTAISASEDAIAELEQSPNVIAATMLANLSNDCSRSDFPEGHGYCGTMAMALVAMRGLLPSLSGLIRDHAAFFVSNPTLPLSAMPFAPV